MISSFLQSLDPQYSLISSNYLLKGIVITFMEELILYWFSKFFFPFRQSMPMGEKFRGFKGNLGFMLLLHLPLMRFASLLVCHARMLYSLYKPS